MRVELRQNTHDWALYSQGCTPSCWPAWGTGSLLGSLWARARVSCRPNGIASTYAAHTELDAQDDARQSTSERNLRGADMFHLRFTLGLFHTLFIIWFAYHGRVPAAGLHPNSLRCFNSREWRCLLCPVGFSLWSPGSWLGGSWVSATLTCLVFLHLLRALAGDVLGSCLLFARSNSSAHKLLQFD